MLTPRMTHLLTEASAAFEDGRDPFQDNWLTDHRVVLDECMSLSSTIALILMGYVRATKDVQSMILLCGATAGTDIPGDLIIDSIKARDVMKRLKAMKS